MGLGDGRKQIVRNVGLTRSDAQAYYERGLQHFAKGNFEEAVVDISEAIHYDPRRAELYSARGYVYIQWTHADRAANKLDDATTDFRYALKLSNKQYLALLGLGIMDFDNGQWAAAAASFSAAQQVAAGRPEAWFYRAIAHYKLGDLEKATGDMTVALRWMDEGDKRQAEANRWLKEFKGAPKP